MILITSFGEFPFIILLSFFLIHFTVKKQKKKELLQDCLCCPVLAVGVYFGLNCGPMEHLEGEQHF